MCNWELGCGPARRPRHAVFLTQNVCVVDGGQTYKDVSCNHLQHFVHLASLSQQLALSRSWDPLPTEHQSGDAGCCLCASADSDVCAAALNL